MPKPSFLLHICCAPCSVYVIELLSEEFEVHCLFYNPNIYPYEEYIKRWEALKNLAEIKKLQQITTNNLVEGTKAQRHKGTEVQNSSIVYSLSFIDSKPSTINQFQNTEYRAQNTDSVVSAQCSVTTEAQSHKDNADCGVRTAECNSERPTIVGTPNPKSKIGSQQLAGRDAQFGRLYNRKLPNYQITKSPNHLQPSASQQAKDKIEWEYENEEWTVLTKDFAEEAEGGKRCSVCYEFRLEKTAKLAQQKGIPYFGTTLTIGPNKKAQVINETGRKLAQKYNLIFFEADFKKKDGFKISTQLSKEIGLYRQNYCGCKYSIR